MRNTKIIGKLERSTSIGNIAAGASTTEDFTLPDNCVNIETQIIAGAIPSVVNPHAVSYRTSSAELLVVAEFNQSGNHYSTYPPIPEMTVVRFSLFNGGTTSEFFLVKVIFHVEVFDDVIVIRSRTTI